MATNVDLHHWGVKGMKWDKKKTPEELAKEEAAAQAESEAYLRDVAAASQQTLDELEKANPDIVEGKHYQLKFDLYISKSKNRKGSSFNVKFTKTKQYNALKVYNAAISTFLGDLFK